jgi:Winged helix-turn-helix DNA-binding
MDEIKQSQGEAISPWTMQYSLRGDELMGVVHDVMQETHGFADWQYHSFDEEPNDWGTAFTSNMHSEHEGKLIAVGKVDAHKTGKVVYSWTGYKDPRQLSDMPSHAAPEAEDFRLEFDKVVLAVHHALHKAESHKGPAEKLLAPTVDDPTDQRILEWVTQDPKLTDTEIGQRLGGRSRAMVNARRRALEKAGYKVR